MEAAYTKIKERRLLTKTKTMMTMRPEWRKTSRTSQRGKQQQQRFPVRDELRVADEWRLKKRKEEWNRLLHHWTTET